jgi:hypothetical protein
MAVAKRLPSTQEHLDIEDIRDDVVLLKNSNAAAVVQTSAVNFDLLSEEEQDAMIFAFASLLNSLTFPIQILIRSKRLDFGKNRSGQKRDSKPGFGGSNRKIPTVHPRSGF